MRLSEVVKQCEPNKQPLAANLVTEITFMKSQLTKLRRDIKKNGSVEHFVNGRQEMDRITPAMQVYVQLTGRYATLHKQLASLIPPDIADQGDELDAFLRELRE